MIPFDNPLWECVAGTDTIGLLQRIEHDEPCGTFNNDDCTWQSLLWDALSHQGTVYVSTYLAIPHIIDTALRGSLAKQVEALVFVGNREVESYPYEPIPNEVLRAYRESLPRIRAASLTIIHGFRCLDKAIWPATPEPTHDFRRSLPSLLYAFGGLRFPKRPIFHQLRNYDESDWTIFLKCPACSTNQKRLHISNEPQSAGSFIRENESIRQAKLARGHEVLQSKPDPCWNEEETESVLAALALEVGHEPLSNAILDVDSAIQCKRCQQSFRVRDGVY